MTIIGVDKNGDEIAEVSVSELDTMFKEIRNKAIDDFFDELQNYEDSDNWLRLKMSSIYQIAEQLKEGSEDYEL